MKILFVITRNKKDFNIFDINKDNDILKLANQYYGARHLILSYHVFLYLKDQHQIQLFMYNSKPIQQQLEHLREKISWADIIIPSTPVQFTNFVTSNTSILIDLQLYKHKEKLRFILNDPYNFYKLIKNITVTTNVLNDFNKKRLNVGLEQFMKFKQYSKFVAEEGKKLINTFYQHTPQEVKECYGEKYKNFYMASTCDLYDMRPRNNVAFEEKRTQFKYVALNPERLFNNRFGKFFNIDKIQRIGCEKLKDLFKENNNALSEQEILDEYNKLRYIISIPCQRPSLTWDRRRILFAMITGGILLTNKHDAKFLGKPFQLDSSIYNLSIEEQKEIAKKQRQHFYSRLMSKEQSINAIKQWLK